MPTLSMIIRKRIISGHDVGGFCTCGFILFPGYNYSSVTLSYQILIRQKTEKKDKTDYRSICFFPSGLIIQKIK